ncbi:hypothetical protein PV10_06536 [Exophiala mesophila]|uniref:TLC domain-containing protein n=1 Tax=Exophiala mesophila TaxID=212818 RepID=A0A0D1WSD4_EXOME|nr:uncharacterized protein PV10_06536 [Exophiala mesophila]KIV92065.1 hypothetical protein PV10_06536 [Exophiala mesophila]
MARSRRTSSRLGADPRGDTGAPAMATSLRLRSRFATESDKSPSKSNHSARPKKPRSLSRRIKRICVRHTWLVPLLASLTVVCGYLVSPGHHNPLRHALFLSYRLEPLTPGTPIMYGKGGHDATFVTFYTIVLSFTREFIMQRLLQPMAFRFGIRGRGRQYRFMEQAYTALYFSILGPLGLYIMSESPLWYFNTTAMFENYPHRTHTALFKAYYLIQFSYWAQQAIVLVLLLEKPRKDFKELVMHHIITLTLIALSYRFHFTYMGLLVYITHDISDLFLATSKTLNYIDSVIVGPFYGLFICIWIYLRHYLNWTFLWAVLTQFRTVGPYELDWSREQYKCWISQIITFVLMTCLQVINIIWLVYIIRVARNYVFNNDRRDERSDDEEEGEEEEQIEEHGTHPDRIEVRADSEKNSQTRH